MCLGKCTAYFVLSQGLHRIVSPDDKFLGFMYVHMYVCRHACMYACRYVCRYVGMYLTCIYIYMHEPYSHRKKGSERSCCHGCWSGRCLTMVFEWLTSYYGSLLVSLRRMFIGSGV